MIQLAFELHEWAASLWSSFSDETKGALIQSSATLFAAAVGFGAIVHQIRAQGIMSRQTIDEAERRKLKSQLFDDSIAICRNYVDSAIELNSRLLSIFSEMELNKKIIDEGLAPHPIKERYTNLVQAHQGFSGSALSLVLLIEERQFVDLRVLVFRDALLSLMHDLSDLVYSRYATELMPLLPIDNPAGGLLHTPSITAETSERGSKLAREGIELVQDAISIASDFQTAMQNLLMGEIFGSRVPYRIPADPSRKVWTLESADHLRTWLSNETSWGKMNAQAIAEAEAQAQLPSGASGDISDSRNPPTGG